MSNKISKKATSATITKEELIKVILIFAVGDIFIAYDGNVNTFIAGII